MVYKIISSVAVVILGFGIVIGTNQFKNHQVLDNSYGMQDFQGVKQNKEEALKTELNIYKVANLTSMDMDVKYEYYNQKMPQWIWEKILKEFEDEIGIGYEEFLDKIPEQFTAMNFYTISIKGYKDANLPNEYQTHDYVLEYWTESGGKIWIALCQKEEPLRDYFFEFEGKKSKIGNTELEISQYRDQYLVNFESDHVHYDIETDGITENELLELLESIMNEKASGNTLVEDKDVNVNEPTNENSSYPDYYAGKYIDKNGNNVVLLCENTETNRRAICSLLGITEDRTTFKTAKYSYHYLTNLQNKISQKMIDKEFDFVTTSAVMEDNNNIKVTVISNNESDWNKIKALDTIGGAIEIQYNENAMEIGQLLNNKEF